MAELSKLSDEQFLALRGQQPGSNVSKLTDEQVKAAGKTPTLLDEAKNKYKALDVGVASGLAGLLGLPHTLAAQGQQLQELYRSELESDTGRTLPRPQGPPPVAMGAPSQDYWSGVIQKQFGTPFEAAGGPAYEPKDKLEKGLKTAGEFSIGAAAPGGPLARLARVAAPTVGSEVLGGLTEGLPVEPYARLTGAVLGGGVQGGAEALLSRPRTPQAILAKQLPAGVTPQMVTEAEALMQHASTLGPDGVRLTWPEALSLVAQRPVLSDTMRHLEASPQSGPRMSEFYGDRPQRIEGAVDQQAQAFSPGPATNPYELGPAVHEAASGVLGAEKQAINARADPQYAAAALQFVEPRELMRLQALPGWNEAAADVRNSSQLSRGVAGLPDSSIGFVNEVKKAMQARGEHATSPMRSTGAPSSQEASGWFSDADVARQTGINASRRQTAPGVPAPYEEALRIETEGRAQRLQPLLQGPLGRIVEAKPEIESAVNVLFPRDPQKIHGEAAVGDAVSRIANVSPKLAEDVVRAHLEMAFDKAGRALQSGPNQAGGAKLNVALAGSGQQRRNIEAAVSALPNGAERLAGFNRFLDVMEATGTRQNVGSRTAYNTEALRDFGQSGTFKDVVQAVGNPLTGVQKLSDRFNQWKLGNNLNELAGILTDPRSANLLRQIAASPRGGLREANVIRALVASQAAQPAIKAAAPEEK